MDAPTGVTIDSVKGFLDRLKEVTIGFADESGQAATYVRQLLRGNRGPHAGTEAPDHAGPPAVRTAAGADTDRVPVLLLQGYLANRGSVHLLARRLHERGHIVMTYRLGHLNTGDIRDTAGLVARKVESLVTQTHIDRVDIVGHSLGGLVGLYYVKRLGGRHRVRRLILLGTPAAGTWSALFAMVATPLGAAGRQLLPGSAFLRELSESPWPAGVELVTVAGEHDFFAPLRSTLLREARHVALPTTHAGFLVRDDVADTVDALLRAPGGRHGSQAGNLV